MPFVIVLCICWPPDLHTQNGRRQEFQTISFERLTSDQGLSQNSVYAILQDRSGFMWFGTHDGLNRYDGYGFKVFRHRADDSTSISNNIVLTMLEDSAGKLWIGTTGGLNRFDPTTESFTQYLHDPEVLESLSADCITALAEDRFGNLWVGTLNGGLNRFAMQERKLTRLLHGTSAQHSLPRNRIFDLLLDRYGDLWVAAENGLYMVETSTAAAANGGTNEHIPIMHFDHDPDDLAPAQSKALIALFEDRAGAIWIIGAAGILVKMIRVNGTTMRFAYFDDKTPTPSSIFHQDEMGRLWLSTWGGGLMLFDGAQQRYLKFTHNEYDAASLSNNAVLSGYVGRDGMLWLGTSGGGLNKAAISNTHFRHYYHRPGDPTSLSNTSIRGLYEDPDGVLWIGGYAGIDLFDRRTGRIRTIQEQPSTPHALAGNSVRVIYPDPEHGGEVLWIGLESFPGLQRLDRRTGRFAQYPRSEPGQPGLADQAVFAIIKDRDGMLWTGSYSGLKSYDEQVERVTHYEHDPARPNSLSNNTVTAICEDRFGRLWIGTDGGLNLRHSGHEGFTRFRHDRKDPASLSDDHIKCIYETKNGALWIGTDGGGLNRLDDAGKNFAHYTMQEGLPDDVIYGILEDRRGHLWLSTNRGISRFDPQSESFKNYGIEDGLQGAEFNGNSYVMSRSGEMFFGGLNGVTAFFPNEVKDDTTDPPVVFTKFKKFGRTVKLDSAITEKSVIELAHTENVVSFEFAALSYRAPKENRYAYKLEGVHDNWVDLGRTREVTFSQLNPGEYVLRVKGSNHDGVWNEAGAQIKLIVRPPFWQQWWFRLLALTAVATLLFAFYLIRTRSIRERNRALQIEIEQRVQAEEQLMHTLTEVEALKNRLQDENVYLRQEITTGHNVENIAGNSAAMQYVLYRLKQFAPSDTTVLILGETGTGKELFARAVHSLSPRKEQPLITVNCAALPRDLIESELFGHEKGAFTGAHRQQIGRFELADCATIFLDEIGELPTPLQAKLLRVLQDSEFQRIGNPQTVKVDVRVIAATNRDLKQDMETGRFREDLFYRLNVFTLHVPPLRARREDIPILVETFVQNFCKKHGKTIESIPQRVMHALQQYDWPGNVRELENVIERAVITSPSSTLRLLDDLHADESNGKDRESLLSLEEVERKHIVETLEKTSWKIEGKAGAAAVLELNPATLRSRMKKLGIKRPE